MRFAMSYQKRSRSKVKRTVLRIILINTLNVYLVYTYWLFEGSLNRNREGFDVLLSPVLQGGVQFFFFLQRIKKVVKSGIRKEDGLK